MKERGITFTPWKAAKIAKLKPGAVIMTRRTMKPQPKVIGHFTDPNSGPVRALYDLENLKCKYGVPGDRLYVREAYRLHMYNDDYKPSSIPSVKYIHYEGDGNPPDWAGKKRPAMFMPKVFHRSGLLVRAVRVERVQDITYEDILAEGWDVKTSKPFGGGTVGDDAKAWFRVLWDSFYAGTKNAWDENPFVWVIEAEKE